MIKWESETTNILGFRVIYRYARLLSDITSPIMKIIPFYHPDCLGRHSSSKALLWHPVSESSRSRMSPTMSASLSASSALRRFNFTFLFFYLTIGKVGVKKLRFFWEISPKSVYPHTHPRVFVRFGRTKGEIRVEKCDFRGDLGGF